MAMSRPVMVMVGRPAAMSQAFDTRPRIRAATRRCGENPRDWRQQTAFDAATGCFTRWSAAGCTRLIISGKVGKFNGLFRNLC
jgi:hypothetical protein